MCALYALKVRYPLVNLCDLARIEAQHMLAQAQHPRASGLLLKDETVCVGNLNLSPA
jgi:hypothetical protein